MSINKKVIKTFKKILKGIGIGLLILFIGTILVTSMMGAYKLGRVLNSAYENLNPDYK